MAKIALVNSVSYRPGINEIGDIIEIVDDHVELSGVGYSTYQVILIQGVTAAEIRGVFTGNWPDRKYTGGYRYWQNSLDLLWYRIQTTTKYGFTVKDVSSQDLLKLQQGSVTPAEKLAIFGTIPAKFTTLTDNNLVTESTTTTTV